MAADITLPRQRPPAPPARAKAQEVVRRMLVVLLLWPLLACTTLAPDAGDPQAVQVPDHWQSSDAAGGGAARASDQAAWWQRFGDPALSRWAERAQLQSPRAAVAEAAWRQAQALRDAAAAVRSPTLGLNAAAGHNTTGSGATQRGNDSLQVGLDAQWVPDVSGAAAQALSAAEAAERASRATLGAVRVQLSGDAALAYIGLRTQQARLTLTQATLASQQRTLQITEWRRQAGLVSMLEQDQARTATSLTEALLPALQTAIAQSRHTLAQLVGTPGAAGADAADDSPSPEMPAVTEAGALQIPANVLRQRADVQAAEHEVAAALSRVGQAEAQRWPSFAIGGSIGLSALTLGALGDGSALVSSLLASVSLPLFDGGARRAQVRVQQAALDQARAGHRSTVLLALKQVEDALVALRGDRERLLTQRDAAASAGNAAVLARQRFSSGLADFQTVLETQRTAFSAQDAVLGTRADLARDHVLLFLALGGGWPDADMTSPPPAGPTARTTTP